MRLQLCGCICTTVAFCFSLFLMLSLVLGEPYSLLVCFEYVGRKKGNLFDSYLILCIAYSFTLKYIILCFFFGLSLLEL